MAEKPDIEKIAEGCKKGDTDVRVSCFGVECARLAKSLVPKRL